MSRKEISILIEKLNQGTLTEEEKNLLDAWYIKYAEEQEMSFDPELLGHQLNLIDTSVKSKLEEHGFTSDHIVKKQVSLWPRIAVAASIVLVFGLGFYLIKKDKKELPHHDRIASKSITPGGNKAILILADGSRISLTDAADGKLASQAGISITKAKDGQLIYSVVDQKTNTANNDFNTIETPSGGQYMINLPDGSKVWLNAESSLKFPVSFAHKNERRVELSGEAYFEVAKVNLKAAENRTEGLPKDRMPFVVSSNGQEVHVLGTHFNINAYHNENSIKTTLLEGSVLVNRAGAKKSVKLIPGQQADLTSDHILLRNVDLEQIVAWKNGLFMFDGEPLTQVMKQLSRWYNVEITYEDDFSGTLIGGSVSKFANIRDVLDILELTGKIKFEIKGTKVVVSSLAK